MKTHSERKQAMSEKLESGEPEWVEGRTHHCIEFANSPNEQDQHHRFFTNPKDAIAFATAMKRSYRRIRASEYAEFENSAGRWVIGWVYTWWSEAMEWGPLPDAGRGYPEDRQYETSYRSIAPESNEAP